MNSTISKSLIPASVAAPRGAEWAASLASTLAAAATAVWRALEAFGERRARQHMLQLAEQYRYARPEVAKLLREASK